MNAARPENSSICTNLVPPGVLPLGAKSNPCAPVKMYGRDPSHCRASGVFFYGGSAVSYRDVSCGSRPTHRDDGAEAEARHLDIEPVALAQLRGLRDGGGQRDLPFWVPFLVAREIHELGAGQRRSGGRLRSLRTYDLVDEGRGRLDFNLDCQALLLSHGGEVSMMMLMG